MAIKYRILYDHKPRYVKKNILNCLILWTVLLLSASLMLLHTVHNAERCSQLPAIGDLMTDSVSMLSGWRNRGEALLHPLKALLRMLQHA
jgi:hypothetical protein